MKRLNFLIFVVIFLIASNINAQSNSAKMNGFVSSLMSKMTLEEKIGQLNLPSAGEFTTGTANNSDIGANVKKGNVGGLFNI